MQVQDLSNAGLRPWILLRLWDDFLDTQPTKSLDFIAVYSSTELNKQLRQVKIYSKIL